MRYIYRSPDLVPVFSISTEVVVTAAVLLDADRLWGVFSIVLTRLPQYPQLSSLAQARHSALQDWLPSDRKISEAACRCRSIFRPQSIKQCIGGNLIAVQSSSDGHWSSGCGVKARCGAWDVKLAPRRTRIPEGRLCHVHQMSEPSKCFFTQTSASSSFMKVYSKLG